MTDRAFLPRTFRLLVKLQCLSICLFATSQVFALDRYLDKAATGLNNGTSAANAWQSWAAINWSTINPGDTLWINGGVYDEYFDVIVEPGVSIVIYPTATQKAVFKGGHIYNCSNGLIDGYLNGTQYFVMHGNASFGRAALQLRDSSHLTVRGVEADREAIWTTDIQSYHVCAVNTCDHVTIEYCYLHHSSEDGINIIAASPTADIYDNFIIRNNRIFHVSDDGIQLGSNTAVTLTGNYIDNDNAPILFGAHPDGIQMNPNGGNLLITGNTFRGFNQNVFIEGAIKNIYIYNNIFIGIRTSGTDRGISASVTSGFTGTFMVANNTFYNFNSFGAMSVSLLSTGVSSSAFVFANNAILNCKFVITSAEGALLDSSNIYYSKPGTLYYNTEGSPTSPPDSFSAGGATFADPGFVSPAAGDFHASSVLSRIVDAGRPLGSFTTDKDGVSRPSGSAWDVGAFELTQTFPVIVTQPLALTVVSGHTVSFQTTASGGTSFQWQSSANGGATWTSLANNSYYSGATTNTLTIGNTPDDLSGLSYRVIVTNAEGTSTSNAAMLTVLPPVFLSPVDVAVATNGRLLVSDNTRNVIKSVTADGQASLLAGDDGLQGNADGTGLFARFRQPGGVAPDPVGNLYIADTGNSLIRKITPDGTVTTVAGSISNQGYRDGVGTAAWFNSPAGIAVDAAGTLYVADTGNSVIRKIATNGTVTTLAGTAGVRGSSDGTGVAARFNQPAALALDSAGNVYVTDTINQTIRRITPAGAVSTWAGLAGVAGADDGNATTTALFNRPSGVTVDGSGNVYVSDTGNSTIRVIRANGMVATLAGLPMISGLRDGTGLDALFNQPMGLRLDGAGNLYVADSGNAVIRRVTLAGAATIVAVSQAGLITTHMITTSTPTSSTPTPAASSGGGASSPWFVLALAVASALRFRARLFRWRSLSSAGFLGGVIE